MSKTSNPSGTLKKQQTNDNAFLCSSGEIKVYYTVKDYLGEGDIDRNDVIKLVKLSDFETYKAEMEKKIWNLQEQVREGVDYNRKVNNNWSASENRLKQQLAEKEKEIKELEGEVEDLKDNLDILGNRDLLIKLTEATKEINRGEYYTNKGEISMPLHKKRLLELEYKLQQQHKEEIQGLKDNLEVALSMIEEYKKKQ